MAEVYTYNAGHLTTVRDGEAEFTQCAELGQVGSFRLALDDTAGTQAIVGQKNFSHTESACSVPLTFRGFIGSRRYGRNAGVDRSPDVGTSRGIEITGEDLNSMLGHRSLRQRGGDTKAEAGKRPDETVAERGAWLMGTEAMALIADNGRCDFNNKGMDETDYRKQFPGDVLADMALAAGGFNYYVADFGSGIELVFRDDNASTDDSSTLRISNDLANASATTLHPFNDATLTRSPDRVKSVIALDHGKGAVTRERAATAVTFNGERYGVASNSNVKTDAKAIRDADLMLERLATEEDIIECTVQVTSAQVNLILAGQRIQAKFSHLTPEGYGSFVWMRVLERTVRPIVADGALYELDLKLSPQEGALSEEPPPGEAGVVQSAFFRSGEGGIVGELPNPVTIGSLLVFVSADRGVNNPSSPNYLDPDQARMGSTAWTKLPNTTNVNDYGSGVAIWYKVADSTERTAWIPSSTAQMGFYELSNATVTGAVTLDESLHANGLTMSLGSLGTAALGSVAFGIILWSDQRMWHAPMPGVAPLSPFVTDYFDSGFEGGAITENEPFVWIGHAEGAGAALTASITRTDAAVLSGIWAGAALLVQSGGGAGPDPEPDPDPDPGELIFDLATGSTLNPWVGPVYSSVGDPGFGLDSDFMHDLSQVSVSGGVTTITAQKVGSIWESACIGTVSTFSFLYGTVEARINYPDGQGVWPALWLLEENTVATPPEIDMLEAYPGVPGPGGGSGPNVFVTSNHYAGGVEYDVHDTGSDNTNELHTYKMIWTAGQMQFYFDGVLYKTMTTNVPSVPMYPIVNLALGAAGYRTDGTTPSTLTMDIEYLRVWAE